MLARGGMAEVYLARMSGVGGFAKLLVIKRILPHLNDDPDFVAMFVNEGRVAARLDHPNICHVYELGEVEGEVFLAMEYLDGLAWSELSPLVPRGRGVELRVAATVIGQICEGLRYAHEYRDVDGTPMPIVHRDVSPQNLFITTEGVCKLLDFGVSKVLTEGSRTRTGMLKGKLPYMAPEQIRGEAIDARADVFSMGVVLWEALTKERLFARDSDYQIWKAITDEEIPRPTSRVAGLPPQIDAVVARALSRDVAARYPTIRAFASELRDVTAAVGGTFDQPTLRDILKSLGAGKLADRHAKVSTALGRPIKSSQPPPIPAAITSENPVVTEVDPTRPLMTEPSITSSIALRDESVRVRRKSKLLPAALALSMVAVGAAIAIALWTADPPSSISSAGSAESESGISSGSNVALAQPVVATTPERQPAEPQGSAPEPNDTPKVAKKRAATKPAPKKPPPKPQPEPAVAEPGFFSIDSKPYATIYIDDKSYGDTPLFKVSLPAGKHRVRAVRADGKSQRLTITIQPGKLTSSGTLAW